MQNSLIYFREQSEQVKIRLLGQELFSALFVFIFCLSSHAFSQQTANIKITQDYSQLIASKQVQLEAESSVLGILKRNFNIETAYGGAFVTRINSVPSSLRQGCDWFFYVNGKIANTGAAGYRLKEGDNIVWDYHCWEKKPVEDKTTLDSKASK